MPPATEQPLLLTRRRVRIIFSALIAGIVPANQRGKCMGPPGGIFGIVAFAIAWFALTLPGKQATQRIDIPGVVQNAVDPAMVGTATSTNNYFREVGAALDVAVCGAIVTAYADSLAPVFRYLIPFIALAFLLALVLKQIPLRRRRHGGPRGGNRRRRGRSP